MNERTQTALDGDLPRTQLTAAEAADLAAAEADISAVLRVVPMATLPDLAPAVMRRIEEAEARRGISSPAGQPAVRAALRWLWQPRPIAWRPAYAVAAAAMLALFVGIGRDTAPVAHDTQQVLTRFVLNAPAASQVTLAGDFTDWQPAYELTSTQPGVWTVVVPLDPGVHNYAFVVDGERWVPDPNAPAVSDGFGGLNSRLAVLAPDAEEL